MEKIMGSGRGTIRLDHAVLHGKTNTRFEIKG